LAQKDIKCATSYRALFTCIYLLQSNTNILHPARKFLFQTIKEFLLFPVEKNYNEFQVKLILFNLIKLI